MSFHDEDELTEDSVGALAPGFGQFVEAVVSPRRVLVVGIGSAGRSYFARFGRADGEDLALSPER